MSSSRNTRVPLKVLASSPAFFWKFTSSARSSIGSVVFLKAMALNSIVLPNGLIPSRVTIDMATLYLPGITSELLCCLIAALNLSAFRVVMLWYLRSQFILCTPFPAVFVSFLTSFPDSSEIEKIRYGATSLFSTLRAESEGIGIGFPSTKSFDSISFLISFRVLGTSFM